MVKVMFVCLGNICRSPAAEGVLQKMLKNYGLEEEVSVSSSGTSAYMVGNPADERMREHATKRGYDLQSKSMQFQPEFFDSQDYIITMDRSNYNNVVKHAESPEDKKKVVAFSNFCVENSIHEVPDPYREGPEGFELVLDLVEDGCHGLIDYLRDRHGI